MTYIPLNDRNNPRPGEAYAWCDHCPAQLQSRAEADAHMAQTKGTRKNGSASHRIRIVNPTRPERVQQQIDTLLTGYLATGFGVIDLHTREFELYDWTREAITEDLGDLVERGDVTRLEVSTALDEHPDLLELWLEQQPEATLLPASQQALFQIAG